MSVTMNGNHATRTVWHLYGQGAPGNWPVACCAIAKLLDEAAVPPGTPMFRALAWLLTLKGEARDE